MAVLSWGKPKVEFAPIGEGVAGEWSTPVRLTGADGKDGKAGPMPRGPVEWDSDKQFEYSDEIVDVVFVKDNNGKPVYYKAKEGAGKIPVGAPVSNANYWQLMNHFDNIATGLLLAENAIIAGLVFHDGKLTSQSGVIHNPLSPDNGQPSKEYTRLDFVPNVVIDGEQGEITLHSANTEYGCKLDINRGTISFNLDGESLISFGYGGDFVYSPYPNQSYTILQTSVRFSGLPTSTAGLTSGRVWQDSSGYLRIV